MPAIEISALAAHQRLTDASDSTLLLDVRELAELESAAVDGALHIPMGEVPTRLEEIPQDRTIICMCHLGGRSAQVAAFLEAQGYQNALNLTGGIEAWARDVDPSVIN
jgi:rhodanese-related sulfurtransferase